MKQKKINQECDNHTMQTKRENAAHLIIVRTAIELGLEKACILGNITGVSIGEAEKMFPYIDPVRLEKLIYELVEDGYLEES